MTMGNVRVYVELFAGDEKFVENRHLACDAGMGIKWLDGEGF